MQKYSSSQTIRIKSLPTFWTSLRATILEVKCLLHSEYNHPYPLFFFTPRELPSLHLFAEKYSSLALLFLFHTINNSSSLRRHFHFISFTWLTHFCFWLPSVSSHRLLIWEIKNWTQNSNKGFSNLIFTQIVMHVGRLKLRLTYFSSGTKIRTFTVHRLLLISCWLNRSYTGLFQSEKGSSRPCACSFISYSQQQSVGFWSTPQASEYGRFLLSL